ncbi:hypothetical protein CJ030_MR1G001441 [Morella rubra]|uniref:Uncharacterized protein n=1 Tax=Morella rubra TaxID=262757 RepID=A0A6A1WMJ1_9ROSI|nr:hypothetical protein CJ030_MR1G001441 [Morella rubra]
MHDLRSTFKLYPAIMEFHATRVFLGICSKTSIAMSKQPTIHVHKHRADETIQHKPFSHQLHVNLLPSFQVKKPST